MFLSFQKKLLCLLIACTEDHIFSPDRLRWLLTLTLALLLLLLARRAELESSGHGRCPMRYPAPPPPHLAAAQHRWLGGSRSGGKPH